MLTSRLPTTLAALLAGLVLLLAAASRQLVHCTSGDGATRIELQRDAQGCHGPHGCRHEHGAPPASTCCGGHQHEDHDHEPGQPTADCGGGCDHVALTIDLADGPRVQLQLPPAPAATTPGAPPTFAAVVPLVARRTPPATGPPRPPGWLRHRAAVVLQL
ncbi:MAG: hypothetical protein R3F29_08460 [Planctomycetota bacterium]